MTPGSICEADDLPAEVLAEIEADVTRYRVARINAARKRLAKAKTPPAFVELTLAEQAEIARRWLDGASLGAITKSLDWDVLSIRRALDEFARAFQADRELDDRSGRRQRVEAALAKFDRGEPPVYQARVRRFSPSHLEQRRATRRATERGSP